MTDNSRGRDEDDCLHGDRNGTERQKESDQLSGGNISRDQKTKNGETSSGFREAGDQQRKFHLEHENRLQFTDHSPHDSKTHSLDQDVTMDFHSLNLNKDTTDVTSEFLTLPNKLSGRASPSVLHKLHEFLSPNYRLGDQSISDVQCRKRSNSDSRLGGQSSHSSRLELGYSYDSRLDYYSSHSPSWMLLDSSSVPSNPSSSHRETKSADYIPEISNDNLSKIRFSDISIVIDSHEPEISFLDQEILKTDDVFPDIPDIVIGGNGNNSNVDDDDERGGDAQENWIGLEPQNKILLSPRSSNGSICSFRSSNADSAIEMLTPEEEMSDMHDFPHHSEPWDSDLVAKSDNEALSLQDFGGYEKSQLSAMWKQVMFNKQTSSQSKRCNDQKQILQSPSLKGPSSVIQPPSVIVSDHSTHTFEEKGSQTEEAETLQDQVDLMDKRFLAFTRCASNSSISSTDTSLSIQSDSSLDLDETSGLGSVVKPKQSSWKKIRNIVHWSPFIQQFKRRRYPWIQLAGHQGNFHAGEQPGAILKKFDSQECKSFHKLMKDVLRPYVPEFRGEASKDGERCIQLQDLLCEFEAPCVMDIKMGCRTYLEEELTKAREKPTLRKDMYQKMVEVDPTAPTAEENQQKAVTKPRYMQWRDEMSSSVEFGFRIEGIRKSDGANIKNFKTTKQRSCIKETLRQFTSDNESVAGTYIRRLKSIRATQELSPFFKSHEIVGSSLLFVHDKTGQASIWMIDFGKTVPIPDNISVDHRSTWIEGNHEDGYLLGISSLIEIFEDLVQEKNQGVKTHDAEHTSDKTKLSDSDVTEKEKKDSKSVTVTDKNNKNLIQTEQRGNTSKGTVTKDTSKESLLDSLC